MGLGCVILCGSEGIETMSKLSVLGDFWEFLKVRKKWWLAPIVVTLLLVGALLVVTESSALAPFIYALF